MQRGIFITFEGPEGSGKSTQIRLLAEALKKMRVPVLVTAEPGGSVLGREIRQLLLHAPVRPSPEAELLLFLADRADHVASVVRPALEKGMVVLCDRYTDSTLAYQGGGRGLPMSRLRRLNREATGNLQPRLTFLMDIPSEKGLARAGKRQGGKKDRMEKERLGFHRRVRATFLSLAKEEPKRFRTLDAMLASQAIAFRVLGILKERFPSLESNDIAKKRLRA